MPVSKETTGRRDDGFDEDDVVGISTFACCRYHIGGVAIKMVPKQVVVQKTNSGGEMRGVGFFLFIILHKNHTYIY